MTAIYLRQKLYLQTEDKTVAWDKVRQLLNQNISNTDIIISTDPNETEYPLKLCVYEKRLEKRRRNMHDIISPSNEGDKTDG